MGTPTGRISRRTLFGGAAAALIAGAAACSGTASSKVRKASASATERPDQGAPRRVIVVGAGLAGLTAALDVRDAGWDVVVLEARERVGGRVHTLYGAEEGAPFDRGLRAEVGGESIDDNHTAIKALLGRFAIATEQRAGGATGREVAGLYRYRGRTYTFDEFSGLGGGAVIADYARVTDEVRKLAEQHRLDPEHPEAAEGAAELDRRTFSGFLDSLHLVPEVRFIAEQANVSIYNAELRDLSLLFVAQQTAATSGVPDSASETMRVAGGNSTLPKAIAAALGRAVVTGAPVTAVRRRPDGVTITAGGRRYFGAHVVLAVPTPPLRAVHFDPPLPAPITTAIAGLDLGAAAKVVNQYRMPFWRALGRSGFSIGDLTYRVSWDAADSYDAPAGLLTTFTTADNGRTLAALPDAARIERVRSELALVLPESPAQLAGPAATVAWQNERFSGGGYAVYKPGQLSAFWGPLRDGTDRVHFAGEHLEALAGYMESAVRSGHRAAARIGRP
jgi:monoamine oxidase